jgi:hypothetical protein
MWLFLRLIIISVLLALSFAGLCQDPYFVSINKSNGLPSNSVYELFQDSRGFIWIANDAGLTRYDGYEFKTYINDKQTLRAGNYIKEDKYGRIWYKNFDGYLYYVLNDKLHALSQSSGVGRTGYAIIDDRLMVLKNEGLDIFDLKTLMVVKEVKLDISNIFSDVAFDGDYCLLLDSTIARIAPSGAIRSTAVPFVGNMTSSASSILIVSRDNTAGYAYQMTAGGAGRKFRTPDISWIHGVTYCNSWYWFFTPNGMWVYDTTGQNINDDMPFFGAHKVSAAIHDRDGNFWIGTLDEGVFLVPDIKTKLIAPPGFVPNIVTVSNNSVFVGTKSNEVYKYNVATADLELKIKGDVPHEVKCIISDPELGRNYISSRRFVVTDAAFKVLSDEQMVIKEMVQVDGKYIALAGSGFSGLLRVRNDITSPWDSIFSATVVSGKPEYCQFLPNTRTRTLAYNPVSSSIYLGSNSGLHVVTPQGGVELKNGNSSIFALKLVRYGSKIFMLTPQAAVFMIDAAGGISAIKGDERKGQQILNIRCAGDNLYVLTAKDLLQVDTLTNKLVPVRFHPCIRSEDIYDIEYTNGKYFFATDRGLIVLGAGMREQPDATPRFIVNRIMVNGVNTMNADLSHLSYKQNDIDIVYSILSFHSTTRYKLYYKINDGQWQLADNAIRNLKLASLASGSYDIAFRLMSDDGAIYPQQLLSFQINKPFWGQGWFWISGFVLLAIGIYSYFKWQTGLLKKRNALVLEKMELEKNLRNSMLTSIRAQMNPHFFYNALNTIQSFIFSDDKRNASTYLVKMSKLTRMILEMSEKESISLEQEIEALALYLDLEKIRFSDEFDFKIDLAERVEAELIKIPSMIVQPYVENAIKHGLLHKKGDKRLRIEFMRINGNLCVTIDDNGIGRVRAEAIKQTRAERHHPFATDANSKRIELLNRERDKSIGVVYIDKADEQGESMGTTVIISIPLN